MAVKSFFNRLKFWKRSINQESAYCDAECSPEYRLANRLKRYEKYVSQIQSVIMWENPAVSVLCIIFVNIVFWIFVSLEWRFYGILSSILLMLSVHDAWTGHVWPEISIAAPQPPPDTPAHPSVVAMSRLLTTFSAAQQQQLAWLRTLRVQQPGLFCCVCSLVCSSLLLLGRTVSGLMLVYTLLMSLLLGPGLVMHFVPPQFRQMVTQYVTCTQQAFTKYSVNEASDDEYLPVTTSEDMALLTRASDLHHDTYDSLTNPGSSSDMASGLSVMPSHEEDSLGTLSDLEPGANLLPLDTADDSDSNPGDHQIEFQSGHFNGDSSSSEEEPFTRDLVFSEADERDSTAVRGLSTLISQAVAGNMLSSVGLFATAMLPRLTADTGVRQRPSRRTESDSDNDDFEIINSEELNNQDGC